MVPGDEAGEGVADVDAAPGEPGISVVPWDDGVAWGCATPVSAADEGVADVAADAV